MPLKIVNMGSSFAAGPGIPPLVHNQAMRSGQNYAHLVADRLQADLTDLSVSGATLSNMLDEAQSMKGQTFAPQADEVPPDADIVLILGGGNDVGYISGIIVDTLKSFWVPRQLFNWFGSRIPPPDTDFEKVTTRYGLVLDKVHAKAPKARVLIIEYLTVLGPDLSFHLLPKEQLEFYRRQSYGLQEAMREAVKGREGWCEVVSVSEPSQEHGVSSSEPWVSGFSWTMLPSGAIFHPNVEGMKAVSEMILERIHARE